MPNPVAGNQKCRDASVEATLFVTPSQSRRIPVSRELAAHTQPIRRRPDYTNWRIDSVRRGIRRRDGVLAHPVTILRRVFLRPSGRVRRLRGSRSCSRGPGGRGGRGSRRLLSSRRCRRCSGSTEKGARCLPGVAVGLAGLRVALMDVPLYSAFGTGQVWTESMP